MYRIQNLERDHFGKRTCEMVLKWFRDRETNISCLVIRAEAVRNVDTVS